MREEIIRRLVARLYGGPVIRNDLRGELVEEIVAAALSDDWELCGSDWGACDLINRRSKLRMQVKQSAARQSWEGSARSGTRFSITHKTGRWEGAKWIAEPSRNAELFVFAWHPVTGPDCDHRDPLQWQFHAVPEFKLPALRSISLSEVAKLAPAVRFDELAHAVAKAIDT